MSLNFSRLEETQLVIYNGYVLYPSDYNPSGHLNMSRIDTISIPYFEIFDPKEYINVSMNEIDYQTFTSFDKFIHYYSTINEFTQGVVLGMLGKAICVYNINIINFIIEHHFDTINDYYECVIPFLGEKKLYDLAYMFYSKFNHFHPKSDIIKYHPIHLAISKLSFDEFMKSINWLKINWLYDENIFIKEMSKYLK